MTQEYLIFAAVIAKFMATPCQIIIAVFAWPSSSRAPLPSDRRRAASAQRM